MHYSEPSEKLIKKTIEIWSKEYGYEICRDDAIEIIQFKELCRNVD